MIQTGLTTAASSGIELNMAGKDPDMVGLGSYLVNGAGESQRLPHAEPHRTEYLPAGNPYLLTPPNGPYYRGQEDQSADLPGRWERFRRVSQSRRNGAHYFPQPHTRQIRDAGRRS